MRSRLKVLDNKKLLFDEVKKKTNKFLKTLSTYFDALSNIFTLK